jgi:BirA family biotin operon repressor/biotin-[acetyl-CoA-carboxylase] ligase
VSDAPNPVSLKNITGKEYNLQECLTLLCSKIDARYRQLKEMQYNELSAEYLTSLYRMGEEAKYIYKEQVISATIIGVSDEGKLMLKIPNSELIKCDFKEIEFVI